MGSHTDFGYLWPWTHGHLLIAAAAFTLYLVARWRRWPMGVRMVAGAPKVLDMRTATRRYAKLRAS